MSETPGETAGLLVTLEGGDGSGKSTQLAALAALAALARTGGHAVVSCREPGGTPLGERLRDALFASEEAPSAEAELLVFAAARAQLVREVIRPALGRGALVLCDRFADSTVAYQQYGRGLDAAAVEAVNAATTGGLKPDLTLLLDISPETTLSRSDAGANYMERQDPEFHRRVRDGYLALARLEPKRWLVLDASRPAEDLTAVIWARLQPLL